MIFDFSKSPTLHLGVGERAQRFLEKHYPVQAERNGAQIAVHHAAKPTAMPGPKAAISSGTLPADDLLFIPPFLKRGRV